MINIQGECNFEESPNQILTRQLRIMESFECLLGEISSKISVLDDKCFSLCNSVYNGQSDLLLLDRRIANISYMLSGNYANKLFRKKSRIVLMRMLRSWRQISHTVTRSRLFIPDGYEKESKTTNCDKSSKMINATPPNLEEEEIPQKVAVSLVHQDEMRRDDQAGISRVASHHQRRSSIQLSPELANKKARLQRIHSRLIMLNPKTITFEYVWTHLSRPRLRHILWTDFLQGVFGIQKSQPSQGIDGSGLIHPSSLFHTCFETLCVALLVCTIFVVPLELSFWSTDEFCQIDGTLFFNMLVDTFFLVDLFYRFLVGIVRPGGDYVDTVPGVARIYLSAPDGFLFNLVTSVPFGWVDWAIINSLCDSDGPGSAAFAHRDNMVIARAVKPVRALKLVRLLRASSMWGHVLVRLDLPPVCLRALTTVCLLVIALHLSACGFWRLKLDTDRDNLVDGLLGTRGLAFDDVGSNYVLCLYFMVTIFATGVHACARPGPRLFACTGVCLGARLTFKTIAQNQPRPPAVRVAPGAQAPSSSDAPLAARPTNHRARACQLGSGTSYRLQRWSGRWCCC
jgi:hypothetical protein